MIRKLQETAHHLTKKVIDQKKSQYRYNHEVKDLWTTEQVITLRSKHGSNGQTQKSQLPFSKKSHEPLVKGYLTVVVEHFAPREPGQ